MVDELHDLSCFAVLLVLCVSFTRMNTEEKIQDFRNKGNICFKNKNISDAIFYYKEGMLLCIINVILIKLNPCR
jgi:hypothetical protein